MSRLLNFISILIVVAAFFYRSFCPHNQAEIELPHLSGSVKIYYDEHGIPHIKATDRKTGAFGLGYAHAVDRLWQLHMNRMISQGRLSEMFGELPVDFDKSLRLLNTVNNCEVILSNMEKEHLEYCQAYADGINAYVKRNPLPLQFYLIWTDFHPWEPIDSCTYLKFMHFQLNLNWNYELTRDYLTAVTKDEDLVNQILPILPEQSDEVTYTMNDEELKEFGWYKNAPKQGFNSRKAKASTYKSLKKNEQKDVGINAQHIKGSNSWAISGKHTKSRKAILANDPHLSNGVPSFWHASKIEYEDGTYVVGSATPGTPAHGSFSTDKISVGITTVHVDNSDIYEEEIRGDNYLFKGKWLPLKTREEVIKIKGKQPIKYQVKSTHHGPLLDDYALALSNLRISFPPELPKGNFSLAWIGLDPHEDTSFHTFLNILKANDVFEITELLVGVKRKETKTKKEDIIVPKGFTQNIIYADHKGNIGYTMSGSLVKRKNKGFGTHISKGSTGENEWIGTIPPNQRPYIINPKKGYLVAANGPTSSLNINSQAVTYMGLQPRATRIDQLVSELVQKKSGKITANDMMEVMKDTKDIVAEKNVKYLIKMSERYIKTLKDKSLEHKIVLEIIKKLKTWQGNFGVDSIEPSYYAVWTRRVMKNFLPEEMIIDETFKIDILNKANSRLTLFRDILNDSTKEEKYCTRYENKTVSSCGELFYLSLRDTAKEFTQKGKLREIQWGQIHRAMYSYGPFSKSEMLQKLGFGTRYTSVGGSEDTVHVHCFDLSDPFFNSGRSANSKLVVDHGEGTYLSIDTGISENIFSGHNFDLNERHTNTDLILMKSLKEVMASADKEADIKINA